MGAISYADNENLRMPNPTGSRRLRSCKKKKNSTDPLPALQPYDLLSISLRQLNTHTIVFQIANRYCPFYGKSLSQTRRSTPSSWSKRCAALRIFFSMLIVIPRHKKKEHQKYSKMETHNEKRQTLPFRHRTSAALSVICSWKNNPSDWLVFSIYMHCTYPTNGARGNDQSPPCSISACNTKNATRAPNPSAEDLSLSRIQLRQEGWLWVIREEEEEENPDTHRARLLFILLAGGRYRCCFRGQCCNEGPGGGGGGKGPTCMVNFGSKFRVSAEVNSMGG